jgi:HEAT repeat protein
VPFAVQYLGDKRTSAAVCRDVFYFLTHLATRHPTVIDAEVRAAIESRLDDKSVARDAKRALKLLAGTPVAKKPRAPARKTGPKKSPAVAAAVRALGHERPAIRAKAAGKLTELLSGDMVDIRSAFPALATALADRSVQVRRSAALAVYYAFDLQRGISELDVLLEPVKRAARDPDPKVAEHAGWALRTMKKRPR